MEKVTKKVDLLLVNSVKEFVKESCETTCMVTANSGRCSVDGKSLLGMFSLNLSKPVEIVIESDNDTAIDEYLESIKKFLVE